MALNPDRVIARIYDTVDDVDALPDVLSALCERIGGESGILTIMPKDQSPVPFSSLLRVDPGLLATFSARHMQNPWAKHMVTHPVEVPISSDAITPWDGFRRTDFYGEICQPQNFAHAALFNVDNTLTFHVAMSLHRSKARGPFTSTELAGSGRFLPHLRRAMQLRFLVERSRRQEKLALETLDQLTLGVLLVDGAGRVLFANTAALNLAASRDAIVLKDGVVGTRRHSQGPPLHDLIASAIAGGPGGALAISRASGALPISALVAPLKGALAAAVAADVQTGAAAIFLTDPEQQPEPSAERLCALYGLTPTEARVALKTVKAGTIAKAASALGISPETVRTHLKRVYDKTGINRQSALARLLAFAAMTRLP